jgi:hypothetical protein
LDRWSKEFVEMKKTLRVLVGFISFLMVFCAMMWAMDYLHQVKPINKDFFFLGGDSTQTTVIDTTFKYGDVDLTPYRSVKFLYQADVAYGSLASCTNFVDLQVGTANGISSDGPGYWKTLTTWVITGDSLYSTTGYNLIYNVPADSALSAYRLRYRTKTVLADSGDGWYNHGSERVATRNYINGTMEVIGRQ